MILQVTARLRMWRSPKGEQPHGVRFLRQAESIAPMMPSNLEVGHRLPLVGPQAPVQERDGRSASGSSSAMSSGRLFLDRVGRHQSPSPLHRHAQTNTHFPRTLSKPERSTLLGSGTFYFALTSGCPAIPANSFPAPSVLTTRCSWTEAANCRSAILGRKARSREVFSFESRLFIPARRRFARTLRNGADCQTGPKGPLGP